MTLLRSISIVPLALGGGLVLAGLAAADQQCFSATIPTQTTNWNNTVAISKFDPNLGVLQQIQFTLSATATGSAKSESLDAAPSTVVLDFQSTLTLTRPDTSVIVVTIPLQSFTENYTAFDGTIDFAGTSGNSHPNISASDSDSVTSPPPASDLLLFQGPPGNPGTITLPVTAQGTSSGTGAGNLILQFAQQAAATVQICYIYEPRVSRFCIGDGAGNGGVDCPCGNNAPVGSFGGCLNPTGLGGLLSFTGQPLVSNDTMVLTLSQLPPLAQGWFVKASEVNGGVVFGHGVRCLRGPLTFVQKIAIGGGQLPPQGGPPLHVIIAALPGDITYFQGIYRALNDACAGPMNTTNGVKLIWGL